jgi:hypothetical protein
MDTEQQRRRALELCDMANKLMSREFPNWQTGTPGPGGRPLRILAFERGDLRIEQKTPLGQGRVPPEVQEQPGNLPDGVNIIWRKRKVLSVEWSRTIEGRVLCYEPGTWESELELWLAPGHGRAH